MNKNTKKEFNLPRLTKLGTVEEMTQVKGGPGTVDTFTSSSLTFESNDSQDVTLP